MPLRVLVPHTPDFVQRRTMWDICDVVWVRTVHGNRILTFAENSRYVILDVHNRVLPDDGDVCRRLSSPSDLVDHLRLALSPGPGQFCPDVSQPASRLVRPPLLLPAVLLTVL